MVQNRPVAKITQTALAGFFILYFLALSCFSRTPPEDYLSAWLMQSKGFWGSINYLTHTWNLRLFPTSISLIISHFYSSSGFNLLFGITTFVLLLIPLASICKKLGLNNSLIMASTFIILLFYITFSIEETWFWPGSSLTYLWSIIAAVHVVNKLIKGALTTSSVFIVSTASIYIGSANEALVIPFTIVLLLTIRYLNKNQRILAFISTGCCLILFFYSALSYGTHERLKLFIVPGFKDGLICFLKVNAKTTLHLLKNVHYIVLTIPFWISQASNSKYIISNKQMKHITYVAIAYYMTYVLFLILIMGDIALNRTMSGISFVLALYICLLAFYIGGKQQKIQSIEIVNWVCNGCLILIIGVSLFTQLPTLYTYAKAVDDRILLLKTENQKVLVTLTPLPQKPRHIYSSEIDTSSSDFKNQFLQHGLGLTFPIQVAKNN